MNADTLTRAITLTQRLSDIIAEIEDEARDKVDRARDTSRSAEIVTQGNLNAAIANAERVEQVRSWLRAQKRTR